MIVAAMMLALVLHGQPEKDIPASQPAANPPPEVVPPPTPPQVFLGKRVEAVRRNVGVIPVVVIVPDAASYVAAIGAWRMTTPPPASPPRPVDPNDPVAPAPQPTVVGTYFPVLIDDGTFQAKEDIARFIRAFKPVKIVLWTAAAKAANTDPARADIEAAVTLAWGGAINGDIGAADSLNARWKSLGFIPPGVVVAAEGDPAWTGALALAAGHGQILVWTKPPSLGGNRPPREVDERYTLEQCDAWSAMIEEACTKTGRTWNALGDDLDCVTLCTNTPAAVNTPTGDQRAMLASTDLIGRTRDEARKRWAWCGQVPGSSARAAYAAMSSLFLQPRNVWMFDGYENSGPFAAYDATAAGAIMKGAGFECIVDDAPSQSDDTWRRRIAGAPELLRDVATSEPGGIGAGFIAVNTSGYADFFDLKPGQCKATDVPILRVPAIVHFVHSWSAHQIGVRSTIGGRFLSNGAYVYIGSVHEPYLSAFVATPLLMQRLLSIAPVGVSARIDDGEPWKVAVIGDPLCMFGPDAPRIETPIALEGATDFAQRLSSAAEKKDADAMIHLLVLSGRDADAARLVRARLLEEPVTLSPSAARVGAMCVFRSVWPVKDSNISDPPKHVAIARLVRIAGDLVKEAPEVRDALWHSVYPALASLNDEVIDVLKANVRPEQLARDAIDLAGAIRRTSGDAAAKSYLRTVREGVEYDPWKRELDRAIGR